MMVAADLPDRFGTYRIVGRLGRGAMGVVYAARDERGREVALKVMLPEIVADEHARGRFLREAQAAARLRHRNIVTVYDCGVDERDCPYIAMELLSGSTLAARLASGEPLPLETTLDIIVQLCEGLQFAHDHGIVHRDVKPANIWLLKNGGVKLLDFGIAKIDGVSVTQHGGIVGSAGYMAPEQLTAHEVDARADVFAAGAVLYELIAGRGPFAAPSVTAVMHHILQTTPPPLGSIVPGISSAIEAAVETALQKDPELRYPQIADLGAELRLAKYGVPTTAAVAAATATTIEGTLIAPRADAGQREPAPTSGAAVMLPPVAPPVATAPRVRSSVGSAQPSAPQWRLPAIALAALVIVGLAVAIARGLSGPGTGDVAAASAKTLATAEVVERAGAAPPQADGADTDRQPVPATAPTTRDLASDVIGRGRGLEDGSRPAAAPPAARAPRTEAVAVHLTGGYPFEVSGCGHAAGPATDHELEVQAPCTLRMRAAEYLLDSSRTIDASGGRVEIAAPQLARVQLRSRFEWCTVILDGHAVGSPPIERELAAGSYVATIQCPDKSYTTRAFFVDPGRSIRRLDEFLP